ncbi:MAG: hypothetical protein J0H55_13385 [Chitinophagaceae bacterium]|nr:hypothetical protein [Chitinophagaceae bacterium]
MNQDKKIESILNSLNGVRRASPGYYFFTRVQERLNDSRSYIEGVIRFITKPAIAIATVMIIILINVFAVLNTVQKPTAQQTSEIASVDEYSQMNLSLSDVEKINP